MGKSIRSKSRQRVLAVRREKYRKIERQKCWEKHLALQASRTEEMEDVEAKPKTEVVENSSESVVPEDTMETDKPKYSNSELRKIQGQWANRRKKRKSKRLGGKKAHAKW